MYLMVGTRPDLAAAVGALSQFAADPCPTHWQALKRVFRYIQDSKTHGIKFQATNEEGLQEYSDADWAGDVETRRSTSGYAFMMTGGERDLWEVVSGEVNAEHCVTSLDQATFKRNLARRWP